MHKVKKKIKKDIHLNHRTGKNPDIFQNRNGELVLKSRPQNRVRDKHRKRAQEAAFNDEYDLQHRPVKTVTITNKHLDEYLR